AVDKIVERTLVNLSRKAVKIVGMIPVVNSRPPKPSARSTSEIVNNMLSIPPFVSNSFTASKSVVPVYPSNQMVQMSDGAIPPMKMAKKVATKLLVAMEMNAGILKRVHRTRIINGIQDDQWIKFVDAKAA